MDFATADTAKFEVGLHVAIRTGNLVVIDGAIDSLVEIEESLLAGLERLKRCVVFLEFVG